MYIDPVIRQTFNFATTIFWDYNPQNVIPVGFENDAHFVHIPKLVLRANPTLFELKQIRSATSPKTSTAQDVGI